jgi:hypothetical protein
VPIPTLTALTRVFVRPPVAGAAPKPEATEAPRAPKPAADTLTLSSAAAMSRLGEVRLAPGEDTLAVTVAPGDTLWKLATRWGALGGTRAFVAAIAKENGLKGDAIQAGQVLRMPYDKESAGLNLLVALAVQKDLAARGKAAPALDLRAIHVGPGPLDSYLVTCPRQDGKGLQHFAIFDDQSGEDDLRWDVQPLEKEEFEKRLRGEF